MSLFNDSWAEMSPCRTYRYALGRRVSSASGRVLFTLLNPSKADEEKNDPTLTRGMGFTRFWGFGELVYCNLYGYRSTDSAQLWKTADPIGPLNDETIARFARSATLIVCGWGRQPKATDRAKDVVRLLRSFGQIHHLGLNNDGSPKHPLYLPSTTQPTLWFEPLPT